jgi:hypothetical protein
MAKYKVVREQGNMFGGSEKFTSKIEELLQKTEAEGYELVNISFCHDAGTPTCYLTWKRDY